MKGRSFMAVLLGLVSSCADGPAPIVGGPQGSSQLVTQSQARDIETISRGIALALDDANLRRDVFDAMRISKKRRHKLVLQDFAKGRGGALIASAAARLGTTESQLRATLSGLPALEFYLPLQRYRRTWKASEEVMVGGVGVKGAPTLRLTGADGREQVLRSTDRLPAAPFLLVRPATLSQSQGLSGAAASLDEEGCEFAIECTPPDEGGGGGYPVTAGVYIDRFFPGDGDGWYGPAEVSMRFYCIGDGNHDCSNATPVEVRRDVAPNEWYHNDILVSARPCSMSNPPPFRLRIWEIDGGGLNGLSDNWGMLDFPPNGYGGEVESYVNGDFKLAIVMICK